MWAMNAPTARTGWQNCPTQATILYNLVDTVPSPRLRFELRLAPLLTQKCNRAISPGCRHATIYKTCLREDTSSSCSHYRSVSQWCKLTLQCSTLNYYTHGKRTKGSIYDTTEKYICNPLPGIILQKYIGVFLPNDFQRNDET